mmetsp:Transcript_1709/g.2570  ORF Transcript_1709/g.2570 Transcript_1709/m.2570 type:complete len:90 (-) Transcript_1709:593-862(-)
MENLYHLLPSWQGKTFSLENEEYIIVDYTGARFANLTSKLNPTLKRRIKVPALIKAYICYVARVAEVELKRLFFHSPCALGTQRKRFES